MQNIQRQVQMFYMQSCDFEVEKSMILSVPRCNKYTNALFIEMFVQFHHLSFFLVLPVLIHLEGPGFLIH